MKASNKTTIPGTRSASGERRAKALLFRFLAALALAVCAGAGAGDARAMSLKRSDFVLRLPESSVPGLIDQTTLQAYVDAYYALKLAQAEPAPAWGQQPPQQWPPPTQQPPPPQQQPPPGYGYGQPPPQQQPPYQQPYRNGPQEEPSEIGYLVGGWGVGFLLGFLENMLFGLAFAGIVSGADSDSAIGLIIVGLIVQLLLQPLAVAGGVHLIAQMSPHYDHSFGTTYLMALAGEALIMAVMFAIASGGGVDMSTGGAIAIGLLSTATVSAFATIGSYASREPLRQRQSLNEGANTPLRRQLELERNTKFSIHDDRKRGLMATVVQLEF